MESKNNVIDLTKRLKKQSSSSQKSSAKAAPVVDMTERRNEILSAERRTVKRTILSEFVGACIVLPDQGLSKVAIYDISENGIAFDVDMRAGRFKEGEEVAIRVYMNQQTYFGFLCKIASVREVDDEGVWRHGGSFVKGTINDVALHHFVKFIETVSASLHKDSGDIMVSGLTR